MRIMRGLQSKFLLSVISLFLIGMGAATALSSIYTKQSIENMVTSEVSALAEGIARDITIWIDRNITELTSWSQKPLFLNALHTTFESQSERQALNKELELLEQHYPFYRTLNLADNQGHVVASSDSAALQLSIEDREYFQKAIEGQVFISGALHDKLSGTPIFMIAVPVQEQGQTIGVLYAVTDLDSFSELFINPIKVGETGYAYITDQKGLMAAHPDPENILVIRSDDTEFGQQIQSQQNGSLIYTYNEIEKIAAFRQSEKSGWIATVTAPTQEVFAPVRTIFYMNLGITGGILLIAIVVVVFLTRSLVLPISKSAAVAATIAMGDLSSTFEDKQLRRSDETGSLSRAMRKMIANLQATARVAEQLAKGDLTVEITRLSERDTLGSALETMLQTLRSVIKGVQEVAANVASSSQIISSGATQLSTGTSSQASATEEVSSSMEQMLANIQQNADNASQTEKIAVKASTDAQESGRAVFATVKAMHSIVQKTAIIQEIAQQTHILSMNASIEAAKAEQYGKGFSVVASEVRSLAARTKEAVAEITSMTAESIEVAEQAGEMLKKLVPDIQRTSDLVQEISAASNEQRMGIEQVTRAIQQLDEGTQQNSATSEELASTSEELAAQAEQLHQTILFFQLAKAKDSENAARTPETEQENTFQQATAIIPEKQENTNGNVKHHVTVMSPGDYDGQHHDSSDFFDQDFERY